MKVQIVSTTDGKFLGRIIHDIFPLMLDDVTEFTPDQPPIKIGGKITRYYNSNYSVDVQEYVEVKPSITSEIINITTPSKD